MGVLQRAVSSALGTAATIKVAGEALKKQEEKKQATDAKAAEKPKEVKQVAYAGYNEYPAEPDLMFRFEQANTQAQSRAKMKTVQKTSYQKHMLKWSEQWRERYSKGSSFGKRER